MITTENKIEKIDASLSRAVEKVVNGYLSAADSQGIVDLYQLVIEQIEIPLYQAVIKHCKFNQSRAAIILGVSRGTLRARLARYFEDQYVGVRD